MLRKIETMLTQLKQDEGITAEALLREEVCLWQDCLMMERRITCWTDEDGGKFVKPSDSGSQFPSKTRKTEWLDVTANLPPELAAYQHFLDSTGGRFGGWTDEEHSTFLRFFTRKSLTTIHARKSIPKSTGSSRKSSDAETLSPEEGPKPTEEVRSVHFDEGVKGDDADPMETTDLHEEVASAIVTKNAQQVAQHEKWWSRLKELSEAKRQAIQAWRATKLIKVIPPENWNPTTATKPRIVMTPAQLENRKIELDRWREERERQVKLQAEVKQKELEKGKKGEMELIRRRQASLKDKVSKFKDEKAIERAAMAGCLAEQAEQERLLRVYRVNQSAERIKLRNDQMLREQEIRKNTPKQEELERAIRIKKAANQLHVSVERDRDRLTKLTKSWQQHVTAEKEPTKVQAGFASLPNRLRQTPNWRKGI